MIRWLFVLLILCFWLGHPIYKKNNKKVSFSEHVIVYYYN